ncbi:MAG TPA: hypothetical protein VFQ76_04900, partial [Longimicrobiaceae bacterium]|nr:hypothetical protein [Longimicrobiaceae bacterium]
GRDAHTVLARAMPILNHEGTGEAGVKEAVQLLLQSSSPDAYIRMIAQRRGVLGGAWAPSDRKVTPIGLRALEMALHEETERRAMEGELAALEAISSACRTSPRRSRRGWAPWADAGGRKDGGHSAGNPEQCVR